MDKLIVAIKNLVDKNVSLEEICTTTGLKTYEVFGIIGMLKERGELYDVINGQICKLKSPKQNEEAVVIDKVNHKSFLFISDPHLCNKRDRLDILNYLYDKAPDKGVTSVFVAGDMTDGYYPNRPQQMYELKAFGADQQAQYVISKYPSRDNVRTYFICGNHDFTHVRNDGVEIGKMIARQRPDMKYLGQDVADIVVGKLKIRLFHGAKQRAYAKSYKLQRYAETIPTIEKPHILLMGHYHDACYFKYLDMDCFQVPALVDQTMFARQQGMENLKGAYWVDIEYDSQGQIVQTTPQLEVFGKQKIKRR